MKQLTLALGALLALSTVACKKSETPSPGPLDIAYDLAAKATEPAAAKPAAPALTVGMREPFPHLSAAAAKPFNSGYASLKAKKYDEAAANFSEVTTLLPDYLSARYQAARAALLGANAVATRQQLEELLSRSYVAYAGRAESSKEFAPFRTSPEWPTYQQSQARIRTAYLQGLGQGLILVARSTSVEPPSFAPGKSGGPSDAKLELRQEAYHYDAESGRFRQLTATEGRVLAAIRSSDGKRLAFVGAERLGRDDKKQWLGELFFGYVDLTTLEVAGPLKLPGGHEELVLGFGASGTPLLSTSGAVVAAGEGLGAGLYELDTAHTGLTKAASDPELKGERVVIRADRVSRSDRPSPLDVVLAEDRHSLKLGSGGVITSARLLADSTLSWSPGQRYFAYAGKLDGCAALRDDQKSEPPKAPQNELFVYEVEKKAAARIDGGPSEFESVWLGDYLLAYESGAGPKSTLNLYDLSTRKKSVLPLHYGAGLVGLPSYRCGDPSPAAPLPPPASAPPAVPPPPPPATP